VGEKNIAAVRKILETMTIPVVYEDCGGNHGRTMLFDSGKAEVGVKTFKRFISPKEAG
jgi:chemotaxis protein CheD